MSHDKNRFEQLIADVRACVAGGEWDRAELYFDDLRLGVTELAHVADARRAGAMLSTLGGVERALNAHKPAIADAALRHMAHLAGDAA